MIAVDLITFHWVKALFPVCFPRFFSTFFSPPPPLFICIHLSLYTHCTYCASSVYTDRSLLVHSTNCCKLSRLLPLTSKASNTPSGHLSVYANTMNYAQLPVAVNLPKNKREKVCCRHLTKLSFSWCVNAIFTELLCSSPVGVWMLCQWCLRWCVDVDVRILC